MYIIKYERSKWLDYLKIYKLLGCFQQKNLFFTKNFGGPWSSSGSATGYMIKVYKNIFKGKLN